MKRNTLLAVATFILVAVVVHAGHTDDFYYSGGRKISLELSTEVVAVTFNEGVTLSEMEIVVSSVLYLDTFDPQSTVGKGRINVLKIKKDVTLAQVKQTIEVLKSAPRILRLNPVYDSHDGRMFLTDEFVVQFKSWVSEPEIESFNEQHGVEIVRKGTYSDLLP
ncbi:MAG: hypothetical protein JSV84_00255 [Gemmatimonadota bacterium]|nr:MAG: hypothetical protein JSV84_00255 [Gemmatimonadota bacterium]